ncbi:MAG: class I SAM-dependent methyltransferase [Oscillospiraceae bacterium]|nr:class I SAM-dependent methyltransferase [Oscillospiraceae bacterium]
MYSNFAGYYDRLTGNVNYTARAEYIYSILKENGISAGPMLDLACGTGSFSAFFAEKGFDLVCADLSPEMLSLAKRKLNGKSAVFLCQNMAELNLPSPAGCAICCLDSINHLSDIGLVKKTFEGVSRSLRPGGIFVFDANTIYKHKHILGANTFVYETGGVFCVWRNIYRGGGLTDIRLDIFEKKNGLYKRSRERFSEKAYSDKTLSLHLRRAGFEILDRYDELTYNLPGGKSQRVFYVARKSK